MSFENKTFFKASETVPFVGKKNRLGPVFQQKDYPQLKNSTPQEEICQIQKRRDGCIKNNSSSGKEVSLHQTEDILNSTLENIIHCPLVLYCESRIRFNIFLATCNVYVAYCVCILTPNQKSCLL